MFLASEETRLPEENPAALSPSLHVNDVLETLWISLLIEKILRMLWSLFRRDGIVNMAALSKTLFFIYPALLWTSFKLVAECFLSAPHTFTTFWCSVPTDLRCVALFPESMSEMVKVRHIYYLPHSVVNKTWVYDICQTLLSALVFF